MKDLKEKAKRKYRELKNRIR